MKLWTSFTFQKEFSNEYHNTFLYNWQLFSFTRNGKRRIVYQRRHHWKHADVLGNCIPARWWRSLLSSIKVGIGRSNAFTKNMFASIGGFPSFQIWWVILGSFNSRKRHWCFWRFIFMPTSVNVAVSPSWIPHVCGFATISGFHRTASSQHMPDAQRLQWDSSTVLNSIWLSMRKVIS